MAAVRALTHTSTIKYSSRVHTQGPLLTIVVKVIDVFLQVCGLASYAHIGGDLIYVRQSPEGPYRKSCYECRRLANAF